MNDTQTTTRLRVYYLVQAVPEGGVRAFSQADKGTGHECLSICRDVVSFVDQSKRRMREFAKRHAGTELLLYYFGPLSGACFLGQQLNAICHSVVIMEDQQPGYAPAFQLKF